MFSALINSKILYNAQIETPPPDLLKIIEKLKKSFLWGRGTPKIAHHSLIGPVEDGGINYKDLQLQIKALNSKFVINLNQCKSNRTALPQAWIKRFFEQTSNVKETDKPYFNDFIEQTLDIVNQCSFKLRRKNKWKGHPFYYECLNNSKS